MPLHVYFVQGTFILMGLALLIAAGSNRSEGSSFWGKPTINQGLFYTGKIALFSSWGIFLYKSITFQQPGYDVPPAFSWMAVLLLILGTIILVLSIYALGKSLKVGLPDEDTKLKTGGLYRFSRNPLYVGVFMVCIASCLYYPNPVNIGLALYGIFVHVKI
ncbi:MAG: methyltransferase, partial [Bacteroidota bacterium]